MSPIIYYSTLSLPEKLLYQLLKFQVRVEQRYITGGSWLFSDGTLWSGGGGYQLQYEYRGHRTHQGWQPNSDIMQCHPHADNRNDGKDWGILCFDAGADLRRDVSSNVRYCCRCWYIQSSVR